MPVINLFNHRDWKNRRENASLSTWNSSVVSWVHKSLTAL